MKVLIVDDEDLIRKALIRVFKAKGHEVFEANNGKDGLELWRSSVPDLVILDILMPGLTGPEVLREMKGSNSSKVIMMSAYSGEKDHSNFKELGVNLFIPKPFENIFSILEEAEKLIKGKT